MRTTVVGGAMLPHAPQFFTLPDTEDKDTVARVKKVAKEIGEKLFDISSEIKEGTYLALMDSLQKLNNGVNDL